MHGSTGGGWKRSEEPGHGHWEWDNRPGNRRKHEGPRTYRQEKQPRQSPTLHNVRRYPTRQGGKLLIKPSKTAMKQIRQRLSAEVRALRGATPADVIGTLNPIIRGW